MSGKKPDKEKLQSKVPSRGRTLGSISVANMVNTADAQMFPTLFPQIEPSLRLTAAQLGLIPTIRLVLQSTTAPLWGWWSDKHSRRRILSTGCFLWALFTIFTGLATQYMDILLWRALTGIGLAVIVPTTQSIAADYFSPEKRGKAFGLIGLFGLVGAIFGTLFATAMVDQTILGIEGWRFVLISWGVISIIAGLVVLFFSKDPLRGGLEPELVRVLTKEKAERYKPKRSDYKKILTKGTFLLILIQGVVGTIPWNGLLFIVEWLQYVGFAPLESGMIMALLIVGTALGTFFGGVIGDKAAKWRPKSGRIIIAQISVFSGIPMTYVMFMLIPAQTSSIIFYVLAGAGTGFLISWCANGCNSPIFTEIFEPEIRSSVFAVDTMIEGSVGAIGTFIVGTLAMLFGYSPTGGVEISALPPGVRAANMMALGQAMFLIAVIPWTLCLVFYTLVYRAYPKDTENLRKTMEKRREEIEKR